MTQKKNAIYVIKILSIHSLHYAKHFWCEFIYIQLFLFKIHLKRLFGYVSYIVKSGTVGGRAFIFIVRGDNVYQGPVYKSYSINARSILSVK